MNTEFSEKFTRILKKAQNVVEVNRGLRTKIGELEEQVVHLQQTLEAMQAEHSELNEQLQQRNLALAVQNNSPVKDHYSEEKIAELVREIDRCIKLLSA